ncbi:hypothetical protein V2J09_021079 [Rumex salicifolius]
MASKEDQTKVLSEGPWAVFGRCLVIKAWTTAFKSSEPLTSTPVWVKVLNLPLQYYAEHLLTLIASSIGEPVKIDPKTLNTNRGRFARLCVAVDLEKPLKRTVLINGERFLLEYEGMPTICFDCGRYGHLKSACPYKPAKAATPQVAVEKPPEKRKEKSPPENGPSSSNTPAPASSKTGFHGSWMVPRYLSRRQKPPANPAVGKGKTTNISHSQPIANKGKEIPRQKVDQNRFSALVVDAAGEKKGGTGGSTSGESRNKNRQHSAGGNAPKFVYLPKNVPTVQVQDKQSFLPKMVNLEPKVTATASTNPIAKVGELTTDLEMQVAQVQASESPGERRPNRISVTKAKRAARLKASCPHPYARTGPLPTSVDLEKAQNVQGLDEVVKPIFSFPSPVPQPQIQDMGVMENGPPIPPDPDPALCEITKDIVLDNMEGETEDLSASQVEGENEFASDPETDSNKRNSNATESDLVTKKNTPNSGIGANKASCRHAIRLLNNRFNPDVLALFETHASGLKADRICASLGFSQNERVEAVGQSGGIWLLWKDQNIQIDVIEKNSQFIHAKVGKRGHCFNLFAVYASPNPSRRRSLWPLLHQCMVNLHHPTFIRGDFNTIMRLDERFGGSGYSGPKYTWSRGRTTANRIAKRRLRWPEASVTNLEPVASDHSPILLRLSPTPTNDPSRRPFRFLAPWMDHPDFQPLLRTEWNPDQDISAALCNLKTKLLAWNKSVFGNIHLRKNRLLRRLQGILKALNRAPNDYLLQLQQDLSTQLEKTLEEEEVLWFQKARDKWLQFGDRNTKFFHTSTIIRRRQNKIEKLKDSSGNWVEDRKDLEEMAFWEDRWALEIPLASIATNPIPDEQATICAQHSRPIGLSQNTEHNDTLRWVETPDGSYSVSKAFALLNQSDAINAQDEDLFKWVWKVPVSEKIRSFLWLLAKEKIFTGMERRRRGLTQDDRCPVCRRAPETLAHLLRDCRKIKQVWLSFIPNHLLNSPVSDFFSWDHKPWMLKNLEIGGPAAQIPNWNITFATIVWWAWKWRNSIVFNNPAPSLYCNEVIQSQIGDFIRSKNLMRPTSLRGPPSVAHISWIKPMEGWFKLNTDGASKGNPGAAGAGGVIRNHSGEWVIGFAANLGVCTAPKAEL